jgi:hypothetical protein
MLSKKNVAASADSVELKYSEEAWPNLILSIINFMWSAPWFARVFLRNLVTRSKAQEECLR